MNHRLSSANHFDSSPGTQHFRVALPRYCNNHGILVLHLDPPSPSAFGRSANATDSVQENLRLWWAGRWAIELSVHLGWCEDFYPDVFYISLLPPATISFALYILIYLYPQADTWSPIEQSFSVVYCSSPKTLILPFLSSRIVSFHNPPWKTNHQRKAYSQKEF